MNLTYIFNREITSPKASLIQAVHMCDAFVSNGINVEMVLPYADGSMDIPSDYFRQRFGIQNRFKVSFYNKIMLFDRLDIIGSYFGIRKYLSKTINTDLFFTRCPLIFTILATRNLPVIFEAHNAKIHNFSELLNRFWTNKIVQSSIMDNCLAFITISNNLGKFWLKKGIPKEKILPLHDGFDKGMFDSYYTKIEARLQLDLPLDKKLVTYTGSLYPDREIDNIINLAKHFLGVLFVIVGGPQSIADQFRTLVKNNNITNIKLTGPIQHSKIPLYLYASDVLLALWSNKVPTINYCSPLKIFEYMAAGRTIVAHSFPTIKEIIRHMENGILTEPNNFGDLIAKLEMALWDENNSIMGKFAKDEAFNEYPWKKRAAKIIAATKIAL